jgi:nicotinic acid mononucleotide adenylyltransferase
MRREELSIVFNEKKKFVLSIGGSFNPPTAGHMAMMSLAHDALVDVFGAGCVLACHFAAAYPDHCVEKLGKSWAISVEHRLQMTNLMCEESGGRPFLPTTRCYGYSTHCLGMMYLNNSDVIHVDVVGGDHARPTREGIDHVTIMIVREGFEEKRHDFAKRKPSRMGVFCNKKATPNALIDNGNEMFIHDNSAAHVSSTKIRDTMKRLRAGSSVEDRQTAIQKLVTDGLLMQSTAT